MVPSFGMRIIVGSTPTTQTGQVAHQVRAPVCEAGGWGSSPNCASTMRYGVIGNTVDFDSTIWGSSPCTSSNVMENCKSCGKKSFLMGTISFIKLFILILGILIILRLLNLI